MAKGYSADSLEIPRGKCAVPYDIPSSSTSDVREPRRACTSPPAPNRAAALDNPLPGEGGRAENRRNKKCGDVEPVRPAATRLAAAAARRCLCHPLVRPCQCPPPLPPVSPPPLPAAACAARWSARASARRRCPPSRRRRCPPLPVPPAGPPVPVPAAAAWSTSAGAVSCPTTEPCPPPPLPAARVTRRRCLLPVPPAAAACCPCPLPAACATCPPLPAARNKQNVVLPSPHVVQLPPVSLLLDAVAKRRSQVSLWKGLWITPCALGLPLRECV
jgi:hypothetical protein